MIASAAASALAISSVATTDVRAIVEEALRDAETRSSLGAGHDGDFFIDSDGGDFRLRIGGFTQFQYTATLRSDAEPDELTEGFSIRRTRVTFRGTAIDESISFKVTNSFSRRTGDSRLSDGYVEKDFGGGWSVRLGQFKLPFWREELHSAKRLLAVDRSLSRDVFSLRRSPAVMVSYEGDRARYQLAVSNGGDSARSSFTDSTDVALTARGRWLLGEGGTFENDRTGGAPRGAPFTWVVSGAAHYELNDTRTPTDPGERIVQWTADTQLNGDGWTLMAAYAGRADSSGLDGRTAHDHAVLAQGAVRFRNNVEPFARIETIFPDADRAGDETLTSLTFGANWYIRGDALKLSADAVWTFDDSRSNDLVGDAGRAAFLDSSSDDQISLRVQLQFIF